MKNELESARKIKSRDMKEKIFKTTNRLMNRYGNEYLTVRNICKMANISTGTFYHHFKNKDELLSYYVSKCYQRYKKENMNLWKELSAQYRIVHLLTWMAKYFMEMGLGFVSNYYSCKNSVLNVRNLDSLAEAHIEIINDIISQLETAYKEGMINSELDAKDIYNELNIVFFGTVFDWCLCLGNHDLAKMINRMLTIHLNFYLTDDYKMKIGSYL